MENEMSWIMTEIEIWDMGYNRGWDIRDGRDMDMGLGNVNCRDMGNDREVDMGINRARDKRYGGVMDLGIGNCKLQGHRN